MLLVLFALAGQWADCVWGLFSLLLFGFGMVNNFYAWREDLRAWRRVKLLKSLADAGDAEAQYLVAQCFDRLDDVKASFRYYKAAAEGGNGQAMLFLGMDAVLCGGSREEEAEGETWLLRAYEAGVADAAEPLAVFYEYGGHYADADAEKAKLWYARAAAAGNENAAKKLRKLAPADDKP